jgi:predicted hydrocarbon binding protein
MIAVADLLKENSRLPGNFFAHDAYVQGDIELGLLNNRQGSRLLAVPAPLLDALYAGLNNEVGPSTGLVLFQFGYQWGKSFYRRFASEVSDYYGQPLAQMEMLQLVQCLQQCWKTCGWGTIELDFDYYEQGFLLVSVKNSAFAQVRLSADRPQCFTEAGLLSAFFSQLTGQGLHCVQTACESMGATTNQFILGLTDRVKVVEAWLQEKQDHETIMLRLCGGQPTQSTRSVDPLIKKFSDQLIEKSGDRLVEKSTDPLIGKFNEQPIAEFSEQLNAPMVEESNELLIVESTEPLVAEPTVESIEPMVEELSEQQLIEQLNAPMVEEPSVQQLIEQLSDPFVGELSEQQLIEQFNEQPFEESIELLTVESIEQLVVELGEPLVEESSEQQLIEQSFEELGE